MYASLLAFCLLISTAPARAADHLERTPTATQNKSLDTFPACERKLLNRRWLHNPLTGEPLDTTDPHGFVTDQMPLTVETMMQAYSVGVHLGGENEDGNAVLYTPQYRGVMILDPADPDANIPRRAQRKMRRMRADGYQVKVDKDIEAVVELCRLQPRLRDRSRGRREASSTREESENWITPKITQLYKKMHMRPERLAHCLGTYYENKLVAGLYVTVVRGVITGESMGYVPGIGDDAAMLALYELRRRAIMKGHRFIDTEDTMGLVLDWSDPREDRRRVPREDFRRMLREQQALNRSFD